VSRAPGELRDRTRGAAAPPVDVYRPQSRRDVKESVASVTSRRHHRRTALRELRPLRALVVTAAVTAAARDRSRMRHR
jgi:hypothetical protein